MAKKEKGTKTPELHEIIKALESYRELLFVSSTVSATKFNHSQSALHMAKNLIRDLYGAPRKGDTAWVK